MLKDCGKACGLCNTATYCTNNGMVWNENCEEWAANNECTDDPRRMLRCGKACGLCNPDRHYTGKVGSQ